MENNLYGSGDGDDHCKHLFPGKAHVPLVWKLLALICYTASLLMRP